MSALSFKIVSTELEQEFPFLINIHLEMVSSKEFLIDGFISLNESVRDLYENLNRNHIDFQIMTSPSAYDHAFRLRSFENVILAKMLWEEL